MPFRPAVAPTTRYKPQPSLRKSTPCSPFGMQPKLLAATPVEERARLSRKGEAEGEQPALRSRWHLRLPVDRLQGQLRSQQDQRHSLFAVEGGGLCVDPTDLPTTARTARVRSGCLTDCLWGQQQSLVRALLPSILSQAGHPRTGPASIRNRGRRSRLFLYGRLVFLYGRLDRERCDDP